MSIQVPLKVFREFDGGPLELHIARFTWRTRRMRTGRVGLGDDVSRKLSFKLQFALTHTCIGLLSHQDGHHSWTWWLFLLPWLGLRVKLKSSSSGIFP